MANRGLGTLTLDLIVRMGGFEKGMDKAARHADRRMREIEKRASAFGKAIGVSLGVSLAGALTGAVAGLKNAIDNMDQLRDASIRLGIGVETLSAFSFAAKQTGTDINELGQGFKILAKNMADALNPKSGKADIFAALGISVTDATGKLKQFEQIIPEIADKFKALEDGTTKAALAQELFGKNGLALTEFLNQGGDGIQKMIDRARELGVVFDQDAADSADAFKDKLDELKAVGAGLSIQLAEKLLPKLTELVTWAVKFTSDGGAAEKIAREISGAFDVMAESASFLWNVLDTGAMTLKGVAFDLAALYKVAEAGQRLRFFDLDGAKQALEDAKEFRQIAGDASRQIGNGWDEFNRKFGETAKAAKAASDALDFKFQIPGVGANSAPFSATSGAFVPQRPGAGVNRDALNNALGNVNPPKPGGGGGGSRGVSEEVREAERLQSAYDSLKASLEERIALFGKEGEAAKLRYDLEFGELAKLDPLRKQELQNLAETIDLQKAEEEQMRKSMDLAQKEAEEKLRGVEATDAYLQDLQFEIDLLGMTNKERERAIALRYADVNATDEQRAAIAQLSDAYYEAREVADFWLEAQHGIADALYDTVTGAKSAGDAVKDFFDNLAKYILRSISENWAERITQLFMGSSMQPTGSVMNPITGATQSNSGGGFDWGALIGAFFGGGRASGGSVNAGMFYRVNENGPELLSVGGSDYLMMGRNSGHVTPNPAQFARGGNGPTNIYVQGSATRETIKQIDRANGRRARREMTRTG